MRKRSVCPSASSNCTNRDDNYPQLSAHLSPMPKSTKFRATTIQEQRRHKATLWRNIRHHQRQGCQEHAELLLSVFKPLLNLRLPRIPRHKL